MTKNRRAELAALVQKSSPTGSAVHVPAVMGEDEAERKKRRRRALAKLLARRGEDDDTLTLEKRIAKGADSAQYIGRLVMNAEQLANWWSVAAFGGASQQLDANPHITVAYSTAEFPWTIDRSWVVIHPEQFDGIGLLGPKNAVVLFLKSPILDARWQQTKDAGATWSYDGYRPHVTLCYLGESYDPQLGGFQSDNVDKPWFPIILGGELMATGGLDVFEAVKAPSWYQDAKGVTT